MSFLTTNNPKIRSQALFLLVLAIIVGVLFFGLRPKNWSGSNNVHWVPEKKALSFHDPSIAYVDDVHIFASGQQVNEWSCQIIAAADNGGKLGFRPLLMLHEGNDLEQFGFWQWGDEVIVMNGDDYEYSRRLPRISAMHALKPGEVSFLTVTSGVAGTRLFVNGALVQEIKTWQVTLPDSGNKMQLILGNSVYGKHNWEGEIYGFAFYDVALTPEKVQLAYDQWLRQKIFAADADNDLQLLYTFNEDPGHTIADRTGKSEQLRIPARQVVLKKSFLGLPGHNFIFNQSFIVDAVLNLIGFIPLGAGLYLWLRQLLPGPEKYALSSTAIFCFLLSLGMEIGQAWLPSRDSSLSDLVLNTLGACLGIVVIRKALQSRALQNFVNR